jgi:hypothetical protein
MRVDVFSHICYNSNIITLLGMSKILSAIGRKLVIDHFASQHLVIHAGATI